MKQSICLIRVSCILIMFLAVPVFSADFTSSLISHEINSEVYFGVSRNVAHALPAELRDVEDEERDNAMLVQANEGAEETAEDEDEDLDYLEDEDDIIADPIEGFNRIMFRVNDKLYFWFLKPVARGYSKIMPERARTGIRNMFNNLKAPIRVANNLLQLKGREALNEFARFSLNTTIGLAGFFDIAKNQADIPVQDEDLGQTLGRWGAGPGFYIVWPVLGPSSLRDTVGFVGDSFLDPVNYVTPTIDRIGIHAGDRINRTSLVIGEYEDIKKDAIDPYIAIRDIYHQYRQNKIDK